MDSRPDLDTLASQPEALRALARRLAAHAHTADDPVQDVFVAAGTVPSRVRAACGWPIRSALNSAGKFNSTYRRRCRLSAETTSGEVQGQEPLSQPGISRHVLGER